MARISVLTPVFNPPLWALEKCVDSVLRQTTHDWELILIDDRSTDQEVVEYLHSLSSVDSRIHTLFRETNGGIAAASQVGLKLATSDYIALLDHDDELHPEALERVLQHLYNSPDCDYLYTDEDKIDPDGKHFDVFLKPDWSPERLRGQNYCCHLSVFRTALAQDVGGFRAGFDGSQDYDLILRVTERAREIAHIPEVLYHWRAIPGSTATSLDEKPQAFLAAQKAVSEHLHRVGIDASVEDGGFGYHRIIRHLKSEPRVSIIIPTCGTEKVIFGNRTILVTNLIDSLHSKTIYSNIEVVVVADTHTPSSVMNDLRQMVNADFHLVEYSKPFNFSDKCNAGFVRSSGDLILLLNDDIEVVDPDWLSTLVSLALEGDVQTLHLHITSVTAIQAIRVESSEFWRSHESVAASPELRRLCAERSTVKSADLACNSQIALTMLILRSKSFRLDTESSGRHTQGCITLSLSREMPWLANVTSTCCSTGGVAFLIKTASVVSIRHSSLSSAV